MGNWTKLGGSGGSMPTFGPGFNVNGTSVTWALDDPSNMFSDPGFEDTPDLSQWSVVHAAGFSIDTSIFFQGLRSAKTTTGDSGIAQSFHCDPLDQFALAVYCRTSSGATGTGAIQVWFLDASGGLVGSSYTLNISPSTSWTRYTVSGTAPANAHKVVAMPAYAYAGITGTWYWDNASLRRINAGDTVQVGAIQTSHLAAGSLGDLSKYSSTVRAIGITSGLPTLPSSNYPSGAIIFNTFDGKLYRNVSGTWSKGSDPADLIAGTIAAGVVYAGQINASQVNAGAFTGCTLTLNANGVTTTINNSYDTGLGDYAGVVVNLNGSYKRALIGYSGLAVFNATSYPIIDVSEGSYGGHAEVRSPGSFPSLGAWLDGAGVVNVYGPSGYAIGYQVNGTQVVGPRYSPRPVTTADIIACLVAHGLSV